MKGLMDNRHILDMIADELLKHSRITGLVNQRLVFFLYSKNQQGKWWNGTSVFYSSSEGRDWETKKSHVFLQWYIIWQLVYILIPYNNEKDIVYQLVFPVRTGLESKCSYLFLFSYTQEVEEKLKGLSPAMFEDFVKPYQIDPDQVYIPFPISLFVVLIGLLHQIYISAEMVEVNFIKLDNWWVIQTISLSLKQNLVQEQFYNSSNYFFAINKFSFLCFPQEGPLPHNNSLRFRPLDIYPAPLHRS